MHFVECAALMATGKPCLLPILEEGMLVRDFALSVREAYGVPDPCSVILCDGETARPLRGMHWLLPNSAIQIKIIEAPPAAVPVTARGYKPPTKGTSDSDADTPQGAKEGVTVYLDGIITPEGHGIGGIYLPATTQSGDSPAVITFKFPDVLSEHDNDLLLKEEAVRYVQQRCGVHCIPKIYCASRHVILSAQATENRDKFTSHWMDVDSSVLTTIRKQAVKAKYL